MQRQLHSTPVKERTPRFHAPSFGLSRPPGRVGSSSLHLQPYFSGEASVVEKQQKELELLIQELKDRDTELNDLVLIQQRQVAAWTEDRQKILQLDERCLQLQGDIASRDHEMALLKSNLAESQSADQERMGQIKALELKVYQCTTENEARVSHCKNLEAQLRRQERSESSLKAIMAEKDAELQSYAQKLEEGNIEAKSKLKELQEAVDQLQAQLREYQKEDHRWEQELQTKEGELLKARQENEIVQSELASSSQAIEQLKTQLRLSGDSERRKDQLLQLQKSKLERCLTELDTLKTISTCQQHDISMLKRSQDPIKSTDSTVGRKSHEREHTKGSLHQKTWTSFEYQPKRHPRDTKNRNRSMPPVIDTDHTGVCPDTSFISVADELSELLSDSTVERHLSSHLGQSHDHPSTTTPRQDLKHPSATTPRQDLKHPSATTPRQDLKHPSATTPRQDLKQPSATNARQDLKHPSATNTRQDLKHPSITKVSPLPQELATIGHGTSDTTLTVDVDHLALQVRDKLSSIFDIPQDKTKPLHSASLLNKKPSNSNITGKIHSS